MTASVDLRPVPDALQELRDRGRVAGLHLGRQQHLADVHADGHLQLDAPLGAQQLGAPPALTRSPATPEPVRTSGLAGIGVTR